MSESAGGRATARGRAGERGDSLIEVMLTVALLGIGFVAILNSVSSSMTISSGSRVRSHADALLVRYAENLIAVPYEPCSGGAGPYATAATSAIPSTDLPDGITVGAPGTAPPQSNAFELSISSVGYWNGDLSPATFSSTCPPSDPGSEELTLLVHAGDGSYNETMIIVKRAS